jgi:hypothetical protein
MTRLIVGMALTPPFVMAVGCDTTVKVIGDPTCRGIAGCSPDDCPSTPPLEGTACEPEGLICDYPADGCTIPFRCIGTRGEDGTEPLRLVWTGIAGGCGDLPVPCLEAADGDVCASVGEVCGFSDECGGEQKVCGPDLLWDVTYWMDDCCYDDCCYDECCGYYEENCPSELPEAGSFCDQEFGCDHDAYSWWVAPPPQCP